MTPNRLPQFFFSQDWNPRVSRAHLHSDTRICFAWQRRLVRRKEKAPKIRPELGGSATQLKLPSEHLASILERSELVGWSAKKGQIEHFRGIDLESQVCFLGLGDLQAWDELPAECRLEDFRQLGARLYKALESSGVQRAGLFVDGLDEACLEGGSPQSSPFLLESFLEGFCLSAYQFTGLKSKVKATQPISITILSQSRSVLKTLESVTQRVLSVTEAVFICRDWSNLPSNIGTPSYYAQESQALAKRWGLKCKVLSASDLKREKMGLMLSVSAGAQREAKLVCLEYEPKTKKGAPLKALVGKGVTFDSGGISIKPSGRMEEMKHDMTGAATCLGAILAAARLGSSNRMLAVLAFTENMPDGASTQPGNVIESRSGTTVEIINTDAEGRLVLADALDYTQDRFEPNQMVNVATLTGAVGVALGKICAGLMGNDAALLKSLKSGAKLTGEKLWELPLYDEYLEDMKSDVADLRNSANDGHGGTIRGGIFLKAFIKKGMPWAHLDIASTAYNVGHLPYQPKRGATGAYVRLLSHWLTVPITNRSDVKALVSKKSKKRKK